MTCMTTRLTEFADAALEHGYENEIVKDSCTDVWQTGRSGCHNDSRNTGKDEQYKYKCEYAAAGYNQRFKTKAGMTIRSSTCNFGYVTTDIKDEVETILASSLRQSRTQIVSRKMDGLSR